MPSDRWREHRPAERTRALIRRLIILVLVANAASFVPTRAADGDGTTPRAVTCPSDARLRQPPPGERPIEVEVGVYVNNLVPINQSNATFEVSAYLFAGWLDPRLAFDPGASGLESLVGCPPSDLWIPRLEFVNAQQIRVIGEYTTIEASGRVRYFKAFEGRFSAEFDLRFFPFDRQNLKIILEPFEFAEGDLVLRPDPRTGGINPEDYARLPEWRVRSFTQTATRSVFAPEGESYSRHLVGIDVRRQYHFYFWNVFAPILFFNFISWSAFWMNPNRWFNNQLTVCISSMLFMITFSFVIKAGLPRVPYLTFIDGLIFVSYTCVFLSLVSAVLIHRLCDRNREDLALLWQARMRAVMPLIFVTANAVVITLLFSID